VRAKIIQYNSGEGTGIAVAEGQQYDFSIRQWRSNTAPAMGQTIDVTLEGNAVSAIFLVAADVLAKERASQLASGLSAQLNAASSRLSAGAAQGNMGKAMLQLLPMPVLAAYAVYLVSALALSAISMKFMGASSSVTLWNLAEADGQFNAGGIRFFLIVAFLSMAVPALWQNKRAWLALLVPAVPLLQMAYGLHSAMNQAKEMTRGMGVSIGDLFSVGMGSYAAGIAAVFLAAYGLKRALLAPAA